MTYWRNLEIENLFKPLEEQFFKHLKAGDTAAIANMYHPNAVLVHRGVRAYFGREGLLNLELLKDVFIEIQKSCEQFCQMSDSFVMKPNYVAEAGNGEYLIFRGTYTMGDHSKTFEYEQIYKKVDGNYLLYHDEFSYE
jgi:ketosteroid isomerase-like protein